ncbi:MAG TPA: phage tail protein [Gaiellaceae bacterium]|nr:phage tail protein [Gaiellaceae bacterium]
MARPFALFRTRDQWVRAAHDDTGIDPDTGGVRLAWTTPPVGGETTPAPPPQRAGGLAFDSHCVLYRSDVADGVVQRMLWRALDPFSVPPDQSASMPELGDTPTGGELQLPSDLIGGAPLPPFGEFTAQAPASAALSEPLGLAVDEDDRLFVCERGTQRLLVYDLPSGRLLRTVRLPGRPLDVAANGRTAYAVLEGEPGLVRLTARDDPVAVPVPPAPGAPARVAVTPAGAVYLLFRDGDDACVVPLDGSLPPYEVLHGLDVEIDGEGQIVVACRPGEAFIRIVAEDGSWSESDPYAARGYDGYGIVRTPDGRIGFWTASGFREAVLARVRYAPLGMVASYRLDSGAFQTEWGRVFLDACIPAGTRVRVCCVTSDEALDDEPALGWLPPQGFEGSVFRPDLSPPLPPERLAPTPGDDDLFHPVHHRETGRELPWARPAADDPFETYEAPVNAEPGRYLWVFLELSGNTRYSPRVRCVRAERPGHDLLHRIPQTFSRDPQVAAFLRRYLALMEGTLEELSDKTEARDILVTPDATPEELLGWLASFLGLTVDERWPIAAVRQLLDEAGGLLRCRGSKSTLERLIELYLGIDTVTILEHWRLRGLGGAFLVDEPTALEGGTIVGETFRVGGAVGEADAPLTGSVEDAFAANAHRFTVVVAAQLSQEQRSVIATILDLHRPAHTIYELCTVGSGMRVGYGLHVGLLSIIGRTSSWDEVQVGGLLGRTGIVGRPQSGMRVGDAPGRVG